MFNLAIVVGSVGVNKLYGIADVQFDNIGTKQSGKIALNGKDTASKFKVIVCLDTFYIDSIAGIPLEELFRKSAEE